MTVGNESPIVSKRRVRSREIATSELDQVASFLSLSFGYSGPYYIEILNSLTQRSTPPGFPRYGYVLLADDVIVGVILTIFSRVRSATRDRIRCHVTAWSVEASYRPYAALFYSKSLSHKDVTYLNFMAIRTSLPFIALQGFSKCSDGQFVAIPMLCHGGPAGTKIVLANSVASGDVDPFEQELLLDHQSYGCLSFWCVTREGAHPFVFQPRTFKSAFPGMQLIYCRDVAEFARFAGPIGRFLARRGRFFVTVNADGPIPGVPGKHISGVQPWYSMGPKPRMGDLAYTQFAMHAPPRKTFRRLWSEFRAKHRTTA